MPSLQAGRGSLFMRQRSTAVPADKYEDVVAYLVSIKRRISESFGDMRVTRRLLPLFYAATQYTLLLVSLGTKFDTWFPSSNLSLWVSRCMSSVF